MREVQRRYDRKIKIKIRTSDAMLAKTTSETNPFAIQLEWTDSDVSV